MRLWKYCLVSGLWIVWLWMVGDGWILTGRVGVWMLFSQELWSNFYWEKNLMEIVFDVLKVMGKVIFIEFVVWFDISCEEVLNELWELKKVGFVDKSVYIWCVVDNNV